MNQRSKATIIVVIQTALLVVALLAATLGLAPQTAAVLLAVAFGVATALVISQLEARPPASPQPAPPAAPEVWLDKDLEPFLKRCQSLGQGDLASAVDLPAGALSPLAVAFNQATQSLGELARSGQETGGTLCRAGAEIERSTQALAAGANRQGSALVDVARRVQALTLRCEEISQVVEVLDDLARQTNVLALNAALEASRAGPSGKGFAMVAEEVRKLAERSAAATKDVGAFVQTLESGSVEAARTLEEVQTLTRSLSEGAAGTAEVSNALMTSAKRLTQTLEQLRIDAPIDNAVRSLAANHMVNLTELVELLRPLVTNENTPLARAVSSLTRAFDETRKITPPTASL